MVVLKRSGSLSFWLVGVGIAVFWAASLFWLILNTTSRSTTATRQVSYASLVNNFQGELTYDILHGKNRIGDLRYRNFMSLDGRSVSWLLHLGFVSSSLGVAKASGFAMFDTSGSLTVFELSLRIAERTSRIHGEAANGVMSLDFEGLEALPASMLPVDSTMTLSDGFLPGLPGVCPETGEVLTWRVFDPLSLEPQDVSLQRYEADILPPAPPDGCVLILSHGDLETFIWVDRAGIVMRERTSLGLELVLAPWEYGTGEHDEEEARFFPEMIGTVDGPPWPSQLVVDVMRSDQLPTSVRQALDSASGFYILRSEQKRWAAEWPVGSPTGLESPTVATDASSRPLEHSMRGQLRPEIPEMTTVDSLASWVFNVIRKGPALWPVSVQEILETRRGDSFARALLLENLLQAAGYQAEICYGLSLRQSTPRFHAWVIVCKDDRCSEVDPSLDTLLPDATMLCMKRGHAAGSPYRLMQTIGKTRVRIVEVEYQ